MEKSDKKQLPRTVSASKLSGTDHPPIRKRSGLYLESTEDEQLGVLPHQCTRVKDAMSQSLSVITPLTEIRDAVRLMKSLDVGALIVCNGSTLVGTLCDRDIALANAPPSEAIHKVMTPDPVYCCENDLLIDAHAMMRAHGLTALPVLDFRGVLSGIVMRAVGNAEMNGPIQTIPGRGTSRT